MGESSLIAFVLTVHDMAFIYLLGIVTRWWSQNGDRQYACDDYLARESVIFACY